MSRAMNVNATEAEVAQICLKKGAIISAIEDLASGGTRVVFTSGDAATAMRKVFGRKLIPGPVIRTPFQRSR
ncbi:hypothetical protein [Sphingomonas sp.]|jgi:hypothetical protein|uniref:hypothetical protein n=1 Tax=Sphingomonas sp. TaxID=28214 RepID=UPI00261BA0D3|nr:hypothetical protein [Sphingomonas sp.]MDF2495710.1 hypothetical protein [Sphingomonas sp.]